jgi:hypothetical protein
VAEQLKSTLKSKFVFTDKPGNGIYHCEAGAAEGGEPDTRSYMMKERAIFLPLSTRMLTMNY